MSKLEFLYYTSRKTLERVAMPRIYKYQFQWFYFLLMLCVLSSPGIAETLAPESVAGAQTINTDKAKSLFDQGFPFIDVRKQEDYNAGHIPGAHHLSIRSDFSEQSLAAIVSRENPVVIYCNGINCMGSSKAAQQAVEWGWSGVYYYRDGIPDWKQNNYPVDSTTP